MARFLSPEWFAALQGSDVSGTPIEGGWVLEQVVTAVPGGDVRYQVEVRHGTPHIRTGALVAPTVIFTSDYPTATAIAQGELSTQAALLDGRVRVSGNLSGLADALGHLRGVDLVPAAVRGSTTY
jgi:hypothetical protein